MTAQGPPPAREHEGQYGAHHDAYRGLQQILDGIRDANYHRPGIRCLRLMRADPAAADRLAAEVALLRARQRPSLAGAPGHVTAWTGPSGRVEQYSLLNASGRCDDFSRDHDLSAFGKRFHHGAHHPALAALIGSLPHLVNFRINVLGPGASLAPHEEHSVVRAKSGAVGIRARFHLPLTTHPAATLLLDGDVHHLEAGAVYLVNHGCVHAAENAGPADRTHLVWDMLLTTEAAAVMFGRGPVPAGFTRTRRRVAPPAARRTVMRWERIAPQVREAEARSVGLLGVQ
ncbi:aspartyl/asparaginyl beta-hydroxylase domain-containing protein [Streptomyces sp. NPDC006430]|uniref:aspartyl/asparaginyl beta-hydroxylase domain-containing protein n=1 Tax=Streptomyces sp. NPDC006430 TaxID=3154299 RepID=UPI0033B3FD14